jgi:hypothetical protein
MQLPTSTAIFLFFTPTNYTQVLSIKGGILDGTVKLYFYFSPVVKSRFHLINSTFGNINGQFTNIQTFGLQDDYSLYVSNDSKYLLLDIVEPMKNFSTWYIIGIILSVFLLSFTIIGIVVVRRPIKRVFRNPLV